MSPRTTLVLLIGALAASLFPPSLHGQSVLYDATTGGSMSDQGWPFFADPIGSHSVTQAITGGATRLDSTSPITDRGGYFSRDPVFGIFTHPRMPTTDRTIGYTVQFTLQIISETHTTGPAGDDNGDGLDDRAGFSVISISQDLRGIELGFWNDRFWAQEDDSAGAARLFTQAESASFDTTAQQRTYELRVLGSEYQVMIDGGVVPSLAGRLRDYTAFTGSLDPYQIPSFLFLGDNTTRGEVVADIAYVAIGAYPSLCRDADALVAQIASQQDSPFFDVNGDGTVNASDLDVWLQQAGARTLGMGRAFLPGDANFDGVVDASDFNVWNTNKFTAGSGWCQGDFNADGAVDISDFNIWNTNKFTASLARAVPEPAALPLVAAGLALSLPRRRPRAR